MNLRLNVRHLNIRPAEMTEAAVEEQIHALGARRPIDEANVRLVRLVDTSPAYEVHVHLVTPGPDVFAESRDHTLRAAFQKAMELLHGQITQRAQKRAQRAKGKLRGRRGG